MIDFIGPYLKAIVVPLAALIAALMVYLTTGDVEDIDPLASAITTFITMAAVYLVPNIKNKSKAKNQRSIE